jgi:hypothetical protein
MKRTFRGVLFGQATARCTYSARSRAPFTRLVQLIREMADSKHGPNLSG